MTIPRRRRSRRRAWTSSSSGTRRRFRSSATSPRIGAGPATAGQVLVFPDLLGFFGGHEPRFVKRYANLREELVRAVSTYTADVRERRFPAPQHTYAVDSSELEAFRRYLDQESLAGSAWDW